MYIGSFQYFMKFEGQTSKNVHDVRNVCLETTLCVLTCFVKFYMFVWDGNDMRGPKLVMIIFGLETSN